MKIGIYRLQLCKPSEVFISDQTNALSKHVDTLLIGRALFGESLGRTRIFCPESLSSLNLVKFLLTASHDENYWSLASEKLDLLHAHFAIDGLYALKLAKRLDIPLVTTLHGFDVTTKRTHFFRSGRPALVRYALMQDQLKKRGDLFICVSRFIRDAAVRSGFPESKLKVHYIGIDTAQFTIAKQDDVPRFVHVARLVEKKGTRYLLQAFALVHKKYSEACLDIIGDGPLRSELEALASSLGIVSAVRFHGVQAHSVVRAALRGATALILPSVTAESGDSEGLGIVLLEASATGVPVIGTLHGGIPEAVEHERTGFLVAERDVSALAMAMDTFISNPSLQARFGIAARNFVCERFDINQQSVQLVEHYKSVYS